MVISPLIALMEDQVNSLLEKKIPAYLLHSGQNEKTRRSQLNAWIDNPYGILYVSPERLKNQKFRDLMNAVKISHIAIDEAHCISQWGHDFRPAYLKISDFIENLNQRPPVIALTATANERVFDEIKAFTGMLNPMVVRQSFERKNIAISFNHTSAPLPRLWSRMKEEMDASSIVYLRSRRGVKSVNETLSSLGVKSQYYHGNISFESRKLISDQWKNASDQCMVATNAFGMGIDKKDVRVVYHLDVPSSVEEYYQEIGRAGRDGLPAYAISFLTPEMNDQLVKKLQASHVNSSSWNRLMERLNELELQAPVRFIIRNECRKIGLSSFQLLNTLSVLEKGGWVMTSEGIKDPSRIMIKEKLLNSKGRNIQNSDAQILKFILAHYDHLFDAHIIVSEEFIADELGIDCQQVIESLLRLENLGIISYQRRKEKPWIKLNEKLQNGIYKEEILPTINASINNLNSMISIIESSSCRMQLILKYFGEEVGDCGICDNCIKKSSSSNPENVIARVFKGLTVGDQFNVHSELMDLDHNQKKMLLNHLQVLEDEDIIVMDGSMITLLKDHSMKL